ncbi:MAG: inosine/xanthosine triphosphatase [Candidatus Paceibacterota bacterium]
MKVIIASKNPNKISAVEEVLRESESFPELEILGNAVPSGVSEQPISLEETIRGAIQRAQSAYGDCMYSVGIESGLMEVPYTKSGYMNICVCVIHDGSVNHIGISSAFEMPTETTKLALKEGIMLDTAFKKLGHTDDDRIGYSGGISEIITKGRSNRKEYAKEAVRMALIHIENPDLY